MLKRKVFSMLIFSLLVIQSFLSNHLLVQAAEPKQAFSDIESSWAKKQIETGVEKGLIQGYPDNTIRPNSHITRAEFVKIVNKIFGYSDISQEGFKDISEGQWFFQDVLLAKQAGYISGYDNGTFRPEKNITREEAAIIVNRLMKLNNVGDVTNLSHFKDVNQINNWSKEYVSSVVKEGYLDGYPDGTFKPEKPVTRAEAIVMLERITGELIVSPGTYGSDDRQQIFSGNVTINTKGVTLRNTIIKGDLYLAAGIGEGEVDLDNVTVEGRTIVNGGGENSIILNNSTINHMIIDKVIGLVRVLTTGDTIIDQTIVKTSAKLEEQNKGKGFSDIIIEASNKNENVQLIGDFGSVVIKTPVSLEVLQNSNISKLETTSEAEGAVLSLKANSIIKNIILNGVSTINGTGTVEFATINVNGAKIDVMVTSYQLSKNVTVTLYGKIINESKSGNVSSGGGGSSSTPPPIVTEPIEDNDGDTNKPQNLVATPISNTEIGLSWDAYPDSDYYHVYYSDSFDGEYAPISETTGEKKQIIETNYIDDSNLPNTTRYYKITAASDEFESSYSNVASAKTYYNKHIVLNINVTDTVQHPTDPIVFITDKGNKSLYSINYETKEIESISFDLPPESIAYANGEVYVSLLKGDHSSYWSDQKGAIAIVDASTLTVTENFDINIDPYDIAVDRHGYFYVAAGSSQWTELKSYSRATLAEVSSSGIRQQSYIHMHPVMDKIYTITTDSSPRDIRAYNLTNNGTYVEASYPGGYDSPYHGEYKMYTNMELSPDGKYIFNGAGTVFNTSASRYDDMRYIYSLNSSFNDIAFNLPESLFYTITSNQVNVYNYENFEQMAKYNTDGNGKVLFTGQDTLIAISELNGKNIIEIIEKNSIELIPPVEHNGIKFDGIVTDLVYESASNKVYVVDEAFNNLYFVDLASQSIESTVKLPYRPSGITLSEDGTKLYIVNNDEDYLVTEIQISDRTITRHLNYTSTPDSRHFSKRHIYNNAGNLYVVLGDWEPKLLIFDVGNFTNISYSTEIKGVGDMVFSNDNSKLYYWYQFGWDAGNAGSNVFAYSINGTTLSKVDQSQLGYPNMLRDPLNTPILLLEDKGILIAKNKVFNMNDLGEVIGEFPEPIYAVSTTRDKAVGKKGEYDLTSFQLTEALSLDSAAKIFYDSSDTLYHLSGNILSSK